MFQSMVVYGIIFCFVIFLAYISEKNKNKNKSIVYIFFIAVVLSLVSGLRAFNVGIDTSNYVHIFHLVYSEQYHLVYEEKSFQKICYILLQIYEEPTFLLLFFSVITNFLIVFRLWDFKDIASLPWMVASYYIVFYFMSFNIIRQFCCVAILFYFSRFIHKRKYFVFILAMIVAYCFHRSALIGLLFFVVEFTQWNMQCLQAKKKLILFLSLILIGGCFVETDLERYYKYFNNVTLNIGFMYPFKLLLLLFSYSLLYKYFDVLASLTQKYLFKSITIYYFLGITLSSLGYFYKYMDRIGILFYLFECVYFGILVKTGKHSVFFQIVIFSLLSYLFILNLTSNGQGQLPYKFVWEMWY